MIQTLLLWSLLLVLPALYLFHISFRRWKFIRAVETFPGPPSYPIIGTTHIFMRKTRREIYSTFKDVFKVYGSICRLWNGSSAEIQLSKPEHMEIIMGNINHIEKAGTYNFLHPWLGQGLLTSKGLRWHSHRKLITPTFHFKILESFIDVFEDKGNILVKKVKKYADGLSFDVFPYITRCTLDIICETAMGTSINAQEDIDSTYISAIYEISELLLERIVNPLLYPDFIYKRTVKGKRHFECLKILHDFTNKVIMDRQKSRVNFKANTSKSTEDDNVYGKKKRLAFLDLLLDSVENGEKLSLTDVREEVDTFMFEGHDTTAAGIAWAIYLLGRHKQIQNDVIDELDNIFQGSDRPPTMQDLSDMKYLERVIKESQRLYPSVPFIGRYLNEDVEIDGYSIPAGCQVSLHITNVNRDPNHWPNPDKFDPDNFLPENVAGRHPYAFVPFSGGPRNCIGQRFAILEEKVIISNILRNYFVESIHKEDEMILLGELILRPENGVHIKLRSRNHTD